MKTSKQIIILILGIALVISIIFPSQNWLRGFLINTIYSTGFTLANYWFFKQIGKKKAWEKEPKQTLIKSIIGLIPLNIIVFFLLNWGLNIFIFHANFKEFWSSQEPLSYFIAVLISCVVALFIINLHLIKKMSQLSHEE